MDKLTYEYYRAEIEEALEYKESQMLLLGRLLEIVKGAWTDGHVQGYTEGKAAGEDNWY